MDLEDYFMFIRHLRKEGHERDLRPSEVEVLLVLGTLGTGLPSQRIAETTGLCTGTTTLALKRLKGRDLVSGSRNYSLTSTGKEVYDVLAV